MININKNLINELSIKMDSEKFSNAYNYLENIFSNIINNNNIPVVQKTIELKVLNEFSTEFFTPMSDLSLALILDAPHIELNISNYNKSKFKNFWRDFVKNWKQYKLEKKEKKRRKKKKKDKKNKKEEIKQDDYKIDSVDLNKYNFNNLTVDLQKGLVDYFTQNTLISIYDNKIKISSIEDLGFNINIYIAFKHSDCFNLYYDKKFIKINFDNRYKNLVRKSYDTKRNIYKVGRIINSLYLNFLNLSLNQILLESVLYNVPNKLFINDNVVESFKQVISYIKNLNIYKCYSINNLNNTIENDSLIKNNDIINFYRFINKINIQ